MARTFEMWVTSRIKVSVEVDDDADYKDAIEKGRKEVEVNHPTLHWTVDPEDVDEVL
jgi:D-serine dehydratase